jgi:hypothetical protein
LHDYPGVGPRYEVRWSVPRLGGWRAWGTARGEFERLSEQEGVTVDVPEALDLSLRSFLKAAGDGAEDWDMADARAEVRRE